MSDVFQWVVAAGVILACLAAIVQAFVLVGLYRAGKEAQQSAKEGLARVKETEGKVTPVLQQIEAFMKSASRIVEENRPRISGIVADLSATAKATREHADRIGELIEDANSRAKARIAQFDETVGATITQAEQVTETVKSAVTRPAKEVNGLVAGLKAALSTYVQGGNRHSPEHATQDEEMFI